MAMSTIIRQRQGKRDTKNRLILSPGNMYQFPYREIDNGEPRLLVVHCDYSDGHANVFDCPPDVEFGNFTRPNFKESKFYKSHIVRELLDREFHVQPMITDIGDCRLLVEHWNTASPN